ncbi:MAG: biopolymer transporter ExbD [Verrucomicrobiota bacterium]
MNIYSKKRQRPTVPIITLIDILAILLIFFIVTTTFKKEESLVKVNLPTSSELEGETDPEPRIPLSVSESGQVSLGNVPIASAELTSALRQWKEENPEGELELRADEGAPLGLMIEVWDAATKAGIQIRDLPLRILLEK